MRISNCSRESLSMKLERLTVYFLISIGSGTGPTTVAEWRAATSIICLTAPSRTPCSYARTLMRRRCVASAAFFDARGARAFFAVFSAVIGPASVRSRVGEHAEYALPYPKTQYIRKAD